MIDIFHELKYVLETDEGTSCSCPLQKILTKLTSLTPERTHKVVESAKEEKDNKKVKPHDKILNRVIEDYIGQYDSAQDIEDNDDEGSRVNPTPPESLIGKIYAKAVDYWYDLNRPPSGDEKEDKAPPPMARMVKLRITLAPKQINQKARKMAPATLTTRTKSSYQNTTTEGPKFSQ
jgi:hypothetical protein